MFMASLVLILSAAMFMFYLQAICQKILRRQFEHSFFKSVVNANRLAFPAIRMEAEGEGRLASYAEARTALKCDYSTLTYLLKHANNINSTFAAEERLLMAYFRAVFFSLTVRRFLGLKETPALMKLTAILQYFSNVVGQRTGQLRLGNLAASDYLVSN